IENLDSYYQNLVRYTLTQEKQPLTRLTTQKDDITVKKAAYLDLKNKFDTLQTAINKLRSSTSTYALKSGRSVSISPLTSGTTVASATVDSSVSAGTYTLSVTTLASAHEVHSAKQTYSNQALGLTGSFVIGGAATRGASITTALPDTVASVSADNASVILPSQKEMGTGSYYVETRNDATNGWQFRIVDADGSAQSVQKGSTAEFTTDWQNITAGSTYDTGRGLRMAFGDSTNLYTAANKATGAVALDYTAKGATIDVTSTMSLVDINSAINAATYGSGNEVLSSIINNTLVLKNASTGLRHVMAASDTTGIVLATLGVTSGGVLNTKVTAKNAVFSVNNMPMERSSNSGLTDVVSGMTLDLASDAEGKSANLVVKTDNTAAQSTINAFLTAFNDLTTYVRGKTSTTKNADETYTRGTLAGEYGIRYVGNELITLMNQDYTNGGIFTNLSQIGITVNSDLSASISNSSALTTALSTNLGDVTKILDAAMEALNNKVATYSGDSGYVKQTIDTYESNITNLNSRIKTINERLSRRETYLVKYYADYQAQMETFMNQSKINSAWYG
ncbi:MAG: flagellar filament capping protein FliD, partial [Leptolinea sp.]|nr:flagellar filament capping protein FliD [Leptolinea sp.]